MNGPETAHAGPADPETERLRVYAALRREELRTGVRKVLYGTMVVGVAVAFFPFAQGLTEYVFAERRAAIEERKEIAIVTARLEQEAQIAERAHRLRSMSDTREFLEALAGEGRSDNIDRRIALAEFYAFLALDDAEREKWGAFLAHLRALRDEQDTREQNARLALMDPDAGWSARAEAEAVLDQIARQRDPGPSAAARPVEGVDAMLQGLVDGAAVERTAARAGLAAAGPGAIPPLLARLADQAGDARFQAEGHLALAEIMRRHKDRRAAIIAMLSEADLAALLIAAQDADRRVRVHAAEFLYDLGDPRTLPLIAEMHAASTPDGRFNFALIAKGAAPFVSPTDAPRMRDLFVSLKRPDAPRANALLNEALALLPG